MSDKWNFQDELQRLAWSWMHKPPTSMSDLFEGFEQAIKPQTPTKKSGFDDVVDDPRTSVPQQQQEDTTPVKSTTKIGLYTCPSCHTDVYGTATFSAVDNAATPVADDQGYFTVNMRMTGIRADKHDCTPKVKR